MSSTWRSVTRAAAATLAVSAVAVVGLSQQVGAGGARPSRVTAGLAPVRECRYSLAARVRPLLFWVGKDNVGEGRIVWLAGENGGQGFELLIGSLPDRAPRKINRWGYISERRDLAGVKVLGFMTEVDAETYEQAEATIGGVPDGSRVFKVIQGDVGEATAASSVTGLAMPDTLTLRDLDAVAAQVPPLDLTTRIAVPPGAQPGFLFAMASLLDQNVAGYLQAGSLPVGTTRTYVYGGRVYQATTRSSRFHEKARIRDRVFTNVLESEFETRQAGRDKRSRFRLVYGTEGDLRGVPVRIVYRPKWWFEADLVMLSAASPARLGDGALPARGFTR